MAITKQRIRELERSEEELIALKSGGVSTWSGYTDSLKDLKSKDLLSLRRGQLLVDLETAFISDSFFKHCIGDFGRNAAMDVLIESGIVFEKLKKK